MSGPMSERAPDITVEADGHADSTTVLVSEGYATPTQPLFTPEDRPRYPPGPFALLISVLRQLTGETQLTLATLSANHASVLDYLCARLAPHADLHLDLEGFPPGRSEELHQAAVLQRLALRRSSPSGAASTSMSSSLAYPELAAPSRVDPRWAFDGTTCVMLSGSGDGPISVQLWLEALKAELEGLFIDKGPDQGRILRQLVEGPLRAKLASKIAETPELQQAVQQREATFDHYAAALISCADPDDALASHYAASHPKRRAGEKLSEAVARVERAFRSAAAYGCQPADAGRFWALYGLLTPQERSAYTGRPGVRSQLQRPFCETEAATGRRLGALLNDLMSWAKAQSTTAAPTPPRPDQRGPDPESRPATPRRRSGRRGAATAAAAVAAVAPAASSAPPSSSDDEAPSPASAAVAAAAAAPAAARDNVVYNYTGNRDHDTTETARRRKQGLCFKCVPGGPIHPFDCPLHPRGERQPRAVRAPQCFAYPPA